MTKPKMSLEMRRRAARVIINANWMREDLSVPQLARMCDMSTRGVQMMARMLGLPPKVSAYAKRRDIPYESKRDAVERWLGGEGIASIARDLEMQYGHLKDKLHYWQELVRTVERKASMKPRPCLRCDRPFDSEGPHNRLCDSCDQYARNNSEFFAVSL